MSPPTLYVALTSHGFGHVAQTAPVVNALMDRHPALRLVIETLAPPALVARHFRHPYTLVAAGTDFGMVMHDSLDVDADASHQRYVAQLAQWDTLVDGCCERLAAHGASLLFGNVPYLPILAADRLGLPSVSMCSLNWATIYDAYCRDMPGAATVHQQLLRAYRAGTVFVGPAPSMPMPELDNVVITGPISRIGRDCRAAIEEQLGIPAGTRVVAVFMGGVHTDLPLADWPRTAGMHWLVAGSDCPARDDMTAIESLPFAYIDVLASVDALITKPGYGSFAEAACNGVPVLYVPRRIWPESPFLADWLHRHGRCRRLERETLHRGDLAGPLAALWAQPCPPPLAPTGIEQIATLLAAHLPTTGSRSSDC